MKHYADNYDDAHPEIGKHERRERPFDYNIGVACFEDLGAHLGMRPEEVPAKRQMRNSVLANLALIGRMGSGTKLFYSRANDDYARHSKYAPGWYTRSVVTQVIDRLVEEGWAFGTRTKPSRYATRRSVIWPTPRLTPALLFIEAEHLAHRPLNAILLRDENKRLIPYQETGETRAMRREVIEQNEALAALGVQIGEVTQMGLYRAGNGRVINTIKRELYRVFNQSRWDLGGRCYGGWWQQLPKHERAKLILDGAASFEHDISACHLRIAYAYAGVSLPQTDPYRLEGLPSILGASHDVARNAAKRAIMVLINAETAPSAHRAICRHLSEANLPMHKTKEVVASIKISMPELKRIWHSGLGLVFQRYDSDVAMRVMRSMRKKGVPVLPVHDSFIVRSSAEMQLKEVVEREFEVCLSKLRSGSKPW